MLVHLFGTLEYRRKEAKKKSRRELIAQFSRSCGREEKASNEPLSSTIELAVDDLQSSACFRGHLSF